VIYDEAVDIATHTSPTQTTPTLVAIHLNNLLGGQIGVDNLDSGTVDATENWWGSPRGPGETGGATTVNGNVSYTPWLSNPIQGLHPKETP
jgi:hypothetical protein